MAKDDGAAPPTASMLGVLRLPAPSISAYSLRRTAAGCSAIERDLAEETPVAIVHDATTTAVMLATPSDLVDFAVGFSLTEGLVADLGQIREVAIAPSELGVEARVWLAGNAGRTLAARRRRRAGPTGCGLCGVESLAEAARTPPQVARRVRLEAEDVSRAMEALARAQTLGAATRAMHAAGWWVPGAGLVAVREDVGRHNALDKLVGALARDGRASDGIVLLTSRVSLEMVQKAAVFGAEIIVAVSAPTALAVRTAEAAGLTLAAVARADAFEIFTHPERIQIAEPRPAPALVAGATP